MSVEDSYLDKAKCILKKAVENDGSGRYNEARENYITGIDLLFKYINTLPVNSQERTGIRTTIDKYMTRAETLKENKPITTKLFKQIQILEESVGHTYESIFSSCFDDLMTEVVIEEPYLIQAYQVGNALMLCELLVLNCKKLKRVIIITGHNSDKNGLNDLSNSLKTYDILMEVKYQDFHDREVRFNNGWIVKMGRGLHFYQPCNRFSIGYSNYSLRRCKRTSIEIYKTYSK